MSELCPACGSRLEAEFRFCPTCGRPRGAAEPATERRLVSVLFLDLVGFTALSEELDAEDVRELLDDYFAAARTAVARQGGSVEKFIGDAVVAVWGVPVAHEDDAVRAITAGLAALRAVKELGVARKLPLAGRAAVATGEAAVSLGAAGQALVAGDLVNTCARLQGIAAPNELLVDSETLRAAGASIDFESAGTHRLRGKQDRVAAWRATGPADERGWGGRHTAPFVGREGELATLLGVLATAAEGDGPQLVTIVGEAGIGKSRLALELQRRALEQQLGFAWEVSRVAGDTGNPFAPLAAIVHRRLGLTDTPAGVRLRQQAIERQLQAAVPDTAERASVANALLALDGSAAAPGRAQAEQFVGWRRYLQALAAEQPIVIALEDAQRASAESLDFFDHMLTWSRRSAIVLLVVARPELLDARPDLGRSAGRNHAIRLAGLHDDEMDALLVALAPQMARATRRLVRQRAAGIPLFAVELAHLLLDRQVGDGVPRRLGADDVPSSLRALIAARIDQLPAAERGMLLDAAVLGSAFAQSALSTLTGRHADDDVAEALDSLVQRGFLTLTSGGAPTHERAFVFVQAIVRDVAYRTLARRERRARHLAIARQLQSAHQPDTDAIAEHLWAAHLATRHEDDRAAVADAARRALRRAADAALARHAPARAYEHLARSIQLTEDRAETALLHEQAAAAARGAARLDDGERHLRAAADLRLELGQPAQAAHDRAQLAGLMLIGQHNRSALRELETAWQAAHAQQADSPALAELAGQIARAHLVQGANETALEWAQQAISLGRRAGIEAIVTDGRITRASVRCFLGIETGLAELRSAIELAAAGGYGWSELRGLNNLAWALIGDDPRASLAAARHGIELAERVSSRDMALQLANVGAYAALETGDWQWIVAALAPLLEGDVPLALRVDGATALTVLAGLRGDSDAQQQLRDLTSLGRHIDDQQRGAIAYAQANALFLAGEHAAARRLALRASRQGWGMDRFNARVLAARCAIWADTIAVARADLRHLDSLGQRGRAAQAARLTIRAGVAAMAGAREAAESAYQDAARAWRSLGLATPLALCLIEWHRLAGGPAEEARATLERLGAEGLHRLLLPPALPVGHVAPAAGA